MGLHVVPIRSGKDSRNILLAHTQMLSNFCLYYPEAIKVKDARDEARAISNKGASIVPCGVSPIL